VSLNTGIEWTDATWNFFGGCSRESEACRHCYAERMTARLAGNANSRYAGLASFRRRAGRNATADARWSGEYRVFLEAMAAPLLRGKFPLNKWVFVNSMSDLFHPEFVAMTGGGVVAVAMAVMALRRDLKFQLLTKRPNVAAEWFRNRGEMARNRGREKHVRALAKAIRYAIHEGYRDIPRLLEILATTESDGRGIMAAAVGLIREQSRGGRPATPRRARNAPLRLDDAQIRHIRRVSPGIPAEVITAFNILGETVGLPQSVDVSIHPDTRVALRVSAGNIGPGFVFLPFAPNEADPPTYARVVVTNYITQDADNGCFISTPDGHLIAAGKGFMCVAARDAAWMGTWELHGGGDSSLLARFNNIETGEPIPHNAPRQRPDPPRAFSTYRQPLEDIHTADGTISASAEGIAPVGIRLPVAGQTDEPVPVEYLLNVDDAHNWSWPLPNVGVGCTAETQADFEKRWPWMRLIPAAWRYLSIEPQLGAVDFAEAAGQRVCNLCGYEGWTREFNLSNAEPDAGLCPECERYCHPRRLLHQVIAGGESGPHARPSHPTWFQNDRATCAKYGTAFFFKQWGEWAPINPVRDDEGEIFLVPANAVYHGEGMAYITPTGPSEFADMLAMQKVGKRRAGRTLDGNVYSEMPTIDPAARNPELTRR
jgi:protein gp37